MNLILLSTILLLNTNQSPEISFSEVCVKAFAGEYLIEYSLDFRGEQASKYKVIVDLSYQVYGEFEPRKIPLNLLSGDIGDKLISLGPRKNITWNVIDDENAPYADGEIILKAVLVTKGNSRKVNSETNAIFRKEKRLGNIYNRLAKRGLTEEEILSNDRYIAVKSKIELKKVSVGKKKKDLIEENNEYIKIEEFDIFTCETNIYEIAHLSATRPRSFEDLTDGLSFRGIRFDKEKVTKLGLDDLIDFSANTRGTYSSFVYIRTKRDVITINDLRYEVVWGCGIMLNILFDNRRFRSFSSFGEASVFLKNNKRKLKYDFTSLGLVGGQFEAELARMQSIIAENPEEFNKMLGSIIELWSKNDVIKTPRIISYSRLK